MQGDSEAGVAAGTVESGAAADQPIIIKKVSGGAGHHGGAWKVAYADFVTAMMALFLVLWLMNSKPEEKEAIASYFNDPKGFAEKMGSGEGAGSSGLHVARDDLEGLANKIEEAMKRMPEFNSSLREQINMTVTGEGLRIELLETEGGMFFESGRPAPTASGEATLALIASELAKLPNEVIIEGHTDSKPFRGREGYSNWELSVDRGNAARRILTGHGLPHAQIVQVRGFADVQLRNADNPNDPSNRRISLIVKFREDASSQLSAETSAAANGPPNEPAGEASEDQEQTETPTPGDSGPAADSAPPAPAKAH